MSIPSKLEEMVAGLISDETRKREETEALLGEVAEGLEQILERIVEFKADPEAPNPDFPFNVLKVAGPSEDPPAPVLSEAERLKNFKAMFQRKGLPPELAAEKAEEMLGMRDGSR
jgi:hypothetical protein